jgi:ABC-type methionine transport system ATPase subunit
MRRRGHLAMPGITVENVFHRGRDEESGPWILDDVSFSVAPGEMLTVIGPSGAGKSTLLRLLAHLESPSRGRILLDGTSLEDIPIAELRARIGMVFQIPALFEGTVADNVLYGLRLRGDESRARASEMLGRVGLDAALLEKDAARLSVGQQQRVALARALVLEPDILLVDEPTSALDPNTAAKIFRLIRDLNREMGLAVVQVTHNVSLARLGGGNLLLLVDGKVIERGTCEDFFSGPETEAGRAFVEGDRD